MNCEQYKQKVSSLLDDDLNTIEQVELFGHLSGCTDCRSFFNIIMKTRAAIKDDKIDFPSEIDELLFNTISERKITYAKKSDGFKKLRTPPFWNIAIPLPVFAVVIILFIIAFIFLIPDASRKIESPDGQYIYLKGNNNSKPPDKVLVIYQMSEVEVLGDPVIKPAKKIKSVNY